MQTKRLSAEQIVMLLRLTKVLMADNQ